MIYTLNTIKNIFNDDIGYVEQWDFSKANLNEKNRILAVTQIASICYQNPKALGSESLFKKLLTETASAESKGLPSSSFEFVPVLLDPRREPDMIILGKIDSNVRKFGEWVTDIADDGKEQQFFLTNYRALVYDCETECKNIDAELKPRVIEDIRNLYLNWFNSEHDCSIIAKHFKVFNYKVDLPTRSQMVRHRVSWQELSRRYVSGKKVPFEFYISENMKDIISVTADDESDIHLDTNDIINTCVNHYYQALENGIKPEEARRILPQALYSQIWGAFMPSQLENFYRLRLDNHAQWEIRQVAQAMKTLEDMGGI